MGESGRRPAGGPRPQDRRQAAGQRYPPIASAGEDREVKRARQALDKTRADYQAVRAQAVPAADPKAKVSPTGPSSLVMPLKKGGFDQLHNVQALATARTQVILAFTRHPSPVDVRALEEGKQLYRQRAATIEPVFAQLTA